jgi:hypothetical protein
MIARNRHESVMGVKALLLRDMGCTLEAQWANKRDYTTNVIRGAKAEAGFPGVHRPPGAAAVVMRGSGRSRPNEDATCKPARRTYEPPTPEASHPVISTNAIPQSLAVM